MMETTDKNITQISPILIHLFILIGMLIYGHGVSDRSFSEPAFTITQLTQANFRRNKYNEVQASRKILKCIETPATLYSILKIYGTF